MDDKNFQDKLKNLVSHSQRISDVMTKINGRIEKWSREKVFLNETLDKIAAEINNSGIENINLETEQTKSSISLKLKPITKGDGEGKMQYIKGGYLVFAPTFHYRISVTYFEPFLSKSEMPKPHYLKDYDVDDLNTDVAFKEVENFMDRVKHFFEKGTDL